VALDSRVTADARLDARGTFGYPGETL